ncbi:MAG: TIGR04076 family protein [bacterium]|nr:TIGR04076 family protein [bacterium]
MSSETSGCHDDGGYRVEVKVLSRTGTCHFGHQVDDVIMFDGETIQGRICISALYSFMPKVFAMRYGAEFPWLKDNKDVSTHACPDAFNPVVFEIRRIRN